MFCFAWWIRRIARKSITTCFVFAEKESCGVLFHIEKNPDSKESFRVLFRVFAFRAEKNPDMFVFFMWKEISSVMFRGEFVESEKKENPDIFVFHAERILSCFFVL